MSRSKRWDLHYPLDRSRAPVGANRSVSAGVIDYEEFVKEAPKTLKTNLVKLAKNNGAELGFLS